MRTVNFVDRAIGIMHEMTATRFDPHLTELFWPIAEEVRNNA
jgi:hypothetical protein